MSHKIHYSNFPITLLFLLLIGTVMYSCGETMTTITTYVHVDCNNMERNPVSAPPEFELEKISDLNFNIGYKGLNFLTDEIGFILGSTNRGGYPILFRTEDGGKTWHEIELEITGDQSPLKLNFKNATTGFITIYDASGCPDDCKNKSVLYKTVDGGYNWEEIEYDSLDGYIFDIEFDSKGHLFTEIKFTSTEGLNTKIYKSEDNGGSWSPFFQTDVQRIIDINKENLFLLSEKNQVITIDQNGNVIQSRETGLRSIRTVRILSENVWFVSTYGGLYRTIDAGQTWKLITAERHKIIHFSSYREGIIIMNKFTCPTDFPLAEGVIAYTKDAGNSWSEGEKSLNLRNSYFTDQRISAKKNFIILKKRLYALTKHQKGSNISP